MRKYYSELESLLAKINNDRLTSLVQEVLLDTRELGLENDKLNEEEAFLSRYIDLETGLYNKNILGKVRNCSSVVMLNIDNLDTFEDSDKRKILRMISEILFNSTRQIDCLCRYSEKEFLIAFVGCDQMVTSNRMDEIREKINNIPNYEIKISMGGSIVESDSTLDTAINRAIGIMHLDTGPKVKTLN